MSDIKSKLPVSLNDEDGAAYSEANPLFVALSNSSGVVDPDYDAATAIASDASSNHDYLIPDTETHALKRVHYSASGLMKIEIQVGDGAAVQVFTTKYTAFNSTAYPAGTLDIESALSQLGLSDPTNFRVVKTNLENQPQDLYSSIEAVKI